MFFGKMIRPFRLSIGTRLTLWGAATTLGVCTVVCVILYFGVSISLRQGIDTFLEGEIHEFMLTVNEYSGDLARAELEIRHELGARTRPDLAFRLFDLDGRLLLSSVSNDPMAKAWKAPADWSNRTSQDFFQTLAIPGVPFPYRTCSLVVPSPDGRGYIAQSSYWLDHVSDALARFKIVCALSLAVAAILSFLVGRFQARRSLQPIRTLTDAANEISTDDLGARVPQSQNDDELDQLAGTINQMLARIDRHVKQLHQFTADTSHELRTPLAAMRGHAELALSSPRSVEELRTVIADNIERYDHLQRIAENLLFLARGDAGQATLRVERLQLDRAIEDVVDLYRPTAEEKGLAISYVQEDAISVFGDGGRLRQLVGNLLDNAIKFTDHPGRISVQLAREDGWATIVIRDTGCGIAPEVLPLVFDRFYRVDRARTTSASKGTGLGLAICRSIVAAHHGNIELQSAPAKGTAATVRLPMADSTAQSDSIKQAIPAVSSLFIA